MASDALQGHTECRTKVCVVCYKKGKRNISSSELSFIQSHLIEGYTTHNLDFPCALCDHCHAVLNERINNDCGNFSTTQIASYDPERPLLLRNTMSCDCKICKVAKSTIFPKKKQKRGRPKSLTEEAETPPTVVKICSKCFSPVGKGHPHNCSRRSKVDNIHRLLSGTPTTSQRVASRIIKEAKTPYLATLGSNLLPIAASTPIPKKQLFTTENISMIQKDPNLSNTQVLTLAEDLRASAGSRQLIEGRLREKLRGINRQLGDLFESKVCTFAKEDLKHKSRDNFEQHVVICNDLNALIDTMIETRGIKEDDMLVRIGLDGGGGFMKICLSVFDMNCAQNREYGKRLEEKFKDSGVKKVMIIAIVPEIQGNYVNVKRLWLESGIDKLKRNFTIATDLKLCNILLGLMSHSSTHPCCWCNIIKGNLDKKRCIKNLKKFDGPFLGFLRGPS